MAIHGHFPPKAVLGPSFSSGHQAAATLASFRRPPAAFGGGRPAERDN